MSTCDFPHAVMKATNLLSKVTCAAAVAAAIFGLSSVAVGQEAAISRQDKEFLKNAAEMGAAEVQLGKLASEKATSADVKALGKKLAEDHSKANTELADLAKKKNVEIPMEPNAAQKRSISAFEKKSGEEFDKEFREHVAKDHEKAIKSFTETAKESKDPDVKAFAEKNIKSLQEHHQSAGGQERR